jgi:hypothetical protein
MQVRYRLPQNNNDNEDQRQHPADWSYLTTTRLLAILFVAYLPVMLLAGIAGLGITESMLLGFVVVIAVLGIVFWPQDAL